MESIRNFYKSSTSTNYCSRANLEHSHNNHELFLKVCLSSPLPIRDLYASSGPQITLMLTTFWALTLITRLQNALRRTLRFPTCHPQHPYRLPIAQATLLQSRDGCRIYPHITHQLIIGETDTSDPRPGLWVVDEGVRNGCHSAGKALYTSFPEHWLTGNHAILYTYKYMQTL
jgi:hypothetical protein